MSQWLKTGLELVIWFINHLQVATTIRYYTIANLLYLQLLLHINFHTLFPLVFTIRFLSTGF
jgi:hypothetical protein